MGDEPILPIIQPVTIDTMLNWITGWNFKVKNRAEFRYVWTLLKNMPTTLILYFMFSSNKKTIIFTSILLRYCELSPFYDIKLITFTLRGDQMNRISFNFLYILLSFRSNHEHRQGSPQQCCRNMVEGRTTFSGRNHCEQFSTFLTTPLRRPWKGLWPGHRNPSWSYCTDWKDPIAVEFAAWRKRVRQIDDNIRNKWFFVSRS